MSSFEAVVSPLVSEKYGLEIGGPSGNRNYIYERTRRMDNVVFAEQTTWALNRKGSAYQYYPNKIGKNIICEATDMKPIRNHQYDFILLCHTLEHVANPLKALRECKRVVKEGGYIIVIVPEKTVCFDHKRPLTEFSILLDKFKRNIGEDDLSSLPEILELHDLSMDPPAGSPDDFRRRSLDNYKNRCLHHHVFSEKLLRQIAKFLNCSIISTGTEGLDIHLIMQVPITSSTDRKHAITSRLQYLHKK